MKKNVFALCLVFSSLMTFGQTNNISGKDFKNLPDTCLIYISALWCEPCIEKQNILEDSIKNLKLNYITIYDKMKFTKEGRDKVIKQPSNKIYILDEKYYASKGFIKIISPKKAINKFYSDLESEKYQITTQRALWFGDCLIKKGNNIEIVDRGKLSQIEFIQLILKKIK